MILLLAACAPHTVLDDVDVTDAVLDGLVLADVGAVGGVRVGGGTLDVTTVEGDELSVPVAVYGPMVGLMVDATVGTELFPFPLVFMDEQVPGSDLLGTYRGLGWSVDAVAGVHSAVTLNDDGVALVLLTVDLGASLGVDESWITLAAAPAR